MITSRLVAGQFLFLFFLPSTLLFALPFHCDLTETEVVLTSGGATFNIGRRGRWGWVRAGGERLHIYGRHAKLGNLNACSKERREFRLLVDTDERKVVASTIPITIEKEKTDKPTDKMKLEMSFEIRKDIPALLLTAGLSNLEEDGKTKVCLFSTSIIKNSGGGYETAKGKYVKKPRADVYLDKLLGRERWVYFGKVRLGFIVPDAFAYMSHSDHLSFAVGRHMVCKTNDKVSLQAVVVAAEDVNGFKSLTARIRASDLDVEKLQGMLSVGTWRRRLGLLGDRLRSIQAKSDSALHWKERTDKELRLFETEITGLTTDINTYTDREEIESVTRKVEARLGDFDFVVSAIGADSVTTSDYLCYVVDPLSSETIRPYAIPASQRRLSTDIKMVVCAGEYEPASFVIQPFFADVDDLKPEPTDLRGANGAIPRSNVDVRVVKCWYVGGEGEVTSYLCKKVFTPELLLKDDSLVKVDTRAKENYLALDFPDGRKYVCISKEKHDMPSVPGVAEFPVRDSPSLLPVHIPKGVNKQFWVTVKVPESASPGIYSGAIALNAKGVPVGELTLSIRVLPFRLARPYYISSIYYKGELTVSGKGKIGTKWASKNPAQYANEMANLFAHGVFNPTLYVRWRGFDEELIARTLAIRTEAGMGGQPLFTFGQTTPVCSTKRELEQLRADAKRYVDFCKSHGATEVYFYGKDEAKGQGLTDQRKSWEAIRAAGGKIFVAGYRKGAHQVHGKGGGNFELMGDIQDVLVCAGYPSKEEADRWHSVGHKILCYGNPQTGIEDPEIYRRNFGLLLWQQDYDGAMDHAYQVSYRHTWNDFDDSGFRDENMTFATADGVIDTIEWEGYREGVDDVRYLTTLIESLDRARRVGNGHKARAITSAEEYLRSLKTAPLKNLNTIRFRLMKHIMELER